MVDRKQKIGRNDRCPCGSGNKYKRCHGNPASDVPPKVLSGQPESPFRVQKLAEHEVPDAVRDRVAQMQQDDRHHLRHFGHARPAISTEFQKHRFVAVGNKLIYLPAEKAKYFTDILLALMPQAFGHEWWDAEVSKIVDERHIAFQWRSRAMKFMNKQLPTLDGVYSAQMTGPMMAYFAFAYDLFVVMDNGRLDVRLLERLKHPDQFQGARHELFAEATCIRAGFTIEHENEADGSTRHAEFTATHNATDEKISVESKSKHRPGVMGRPGDREAIGSHKLPIGRLLNDAIAKNTPYPLVVFLDMNLPVESAQRLLSVAPPHPLIHRTMDRTRVGDQKLDPINLLVATNHPERYIEDEDLAQYHQLLSLIALRPLKPMKKPDALQAIHRAANLHGNIPVFFPKQSGN